jgi:hypothetical protein
MGKRYKVPMEKLLEILIFKAAGGSIICPLRDRQEDEKLYPGLFKISISK